METVGFIGLGIMGAPMARNLQQAGYSLVILSGSAKASEFKEQGATVADTPASLAAQSDVVITMVPDTPDVERLMFGKTGIMEGIREGSLFIDMSTIAPVTSRKIAGQLSAKRVAALDAPVSGGQSGAESGALSIMVGGDEQAYIRALPLFRKMGKNIVRIGESGSGQVAKVCNQMMVAMNILGVAEAMTLARKSGVDLARVREALLGGFAQSRILDLYGQRIIDRNFDPGFKVRLHRKDMNIVLQTARELSVPVFGSATVTNHMDSLISMGKGDLDNSSIVQVIEQLSGIDFDVQQ